MSPWSAIAVLWAACGCAASSSWGGLRGGGRDSPLQLIDASGTLSAAALSTLTAEAAPSLSLVASIGGKWRGRCLLNKAFGTSFSSTLGDPAPAGAALDGDASAWYLDCCAADGAEGGAAECALAGLALGIADAVLVHSPCVQPDDADLTATYATLFARAPADAARKTPQLLVHVRVLFTLKNYTHTPSLSPPPPY